VKAITAATLGLTYASTNGRYGEKKEEHSMRYAMALLLALGIGIAATPAAMASDRTDRACVREVSQRELRAGSTIPADVYIARPQRVVFRPERVL
jgi:hypothetical protein